MNVIEILNVSTFNKFWTLFPLDQPGPTGGKYLIKSSFDIKIKIDMFEIRIQPNFNKFWAFFILGPIGA